ncbi:MAG: prepilin-type N-terminal cleavage/methylation domain-containing protein [Bradyrhizobium sp.]|nr:prepilin-type N-terminal cleavage/methylation domain-containing protein [Pseudomonadota bacterium]MDE2471416.1 prepilin-type N-terminal cleavage/methylation domain-containing protein [Bradyrhizobium sp.]
MTDYTEQAKQESEAGFTLVELLVALALFSLLTTVLFNNVQFGLKTWNKTSHGIEQLDRTVVVQDLLRRLISNLYPMTISENGGQPVVKFDGSRETLSFLGNAPLVAGGAGRFQYRLWVERSGAQRNLVLTSVQELGAPENQSMSAKTILLSDIVGADFSYFGPARAHEAGAWTENWSRRSDIPRLVRIRVAFDEIEGRAWPEFVIAPHVLADVGCVYDPITMGCRGR